MSLDSEVQKIKKNDSLSVAEKLDKISMLYVNENYTVGSRTENQLQMVKKKTFSFLWAFLWFLLWGVGLIVYILYYLSKKDEVYTITFPKKEKEVKQDSESVADEIKKLSELLEKGLLSEDEFSVQKNKILSGNI